jgi:catechol 2,3-dioxygenase-like lactoylglutathione lyase family enzyme
VVYVIHHVQLACPPDGEADLRNFYGDVLGMTEIPKPAALAGRGGAWFRMPALGGDIELHLGVENAFTPALKAHPGLLVADLDAYAARLTAAGYPVKWDSDFPGMRRFYSHDCNNNRLEFLTPLP